VREPSAEREHPGILPRQGQLALLVVVVTLIAVGCVVGIVALAVGSGAAKFADGLVVHTTHSKTSPDGRWALVIDTVDEGALGGNTTVYLKATSRGGDVANTTLWNLDWLPDSEVRWLDARTVSINGLLEAPFVGHSIATGSPGTTGAVTDSAGYAHNSIAPGERLVMLSGLSAVLPEGLSGELLTRKKASPSYPFQRLIPSRRVAWSIRSLQRRAAAPLTSLTTAGTVIGRSAEHCITVRWDRAARRLIVLTWISGAYYGLIVERDVAAQNGQQARLRAEALWRELSVRGVPLPW
jgi:hypothetical protein